MSNPRKISTVIRLITAGAILTLAAYWAGARWGQRQPIDVGAGARRRKQVRPAPPRLQTTKRVP